MLYDVMYDINPSEARYPLRCIPSTCIWLPFHAKANRISTAHTTVLGTAEHEPLTLTIVGSVVSATFYNTRGGVAKRPTLVLRVLTLQDGAAIHHL